jgi:hypothetical protein
MIVAEVCGVLGILKETAKMDEPQHSTGKNCIHTEVSRTTRDWPTYRLLKKSG